MATVALIVGLVANYIDRLATRHGSRGPDDPDHNHPAVRNIGVCRQLPAPRRLPGTVTALLGAGNRSGAVSGMTLVVQLIKATVTRAQRAPPGCADVRHAVRAAWCTCSPHGLRSSSEARKLEASDASRLRSARSQRWKPHIELD